MSKGFKKPPKPDETEGTEDSFQSYEATHEEQLEAIRLASQIDPPEPKTMYGPLGRIATKLGAPHTEFDPIGLYAMLVAAYGNAVSPHAVLNFGAIKAFPIEFAGIIGITNNTRKSSAMHQVFDVISEVDPTWAERLRPDAASSEYIVEQVRDQRTEKKIKKEVEEIIVTDPGVEDKRLTIGYDELVSLFIKAERKGNTLLETIRRAWDCLPLWPGAKGNKDRSKHPRIAVIGCATPIDIKKRLPETFLEDGTGNRFLWILVREQSAVPRGGPTTEVVQDEIEGLRIAHCRFAAEANPTRIELTEDAGELWDTVIYPEVRKRDEKYRFLYRSEAHVIRIAVILTMADNKRFITPEHLEAANKLWRYCSRCAIAIFSPSRISDDAMLVHEYLGIRGSEGATKNMIGHQVFKGHKTVAERADILQELLDNGLARKEGKRPEKWFAAKPDNDSPPDDNSPPDNGPQDDGDPPDDDNSPGNSTDAEKPNVATFATFEAVEKKREKKRVVVL